MTLPLVMCAVGLAALYVHLQAPLFAVDATVPYGPWPNPNHSRSTPMPTTIPVPATTDLELGDVTATSEHPTLGNGSDPAVDVIVNYTVAHEPHGDHCIRVGGLMLTADQAIQLCKVLEPVARQVAELRQLQGDTT